MCFFGLRSVLVTFSICILKFAAEVFSLVVSSNINIKLNEITFMKLFAQRMLTFKIGSACAFDSKNFKCAQNLIWKYFNLLSKKKFFGAHHSKITIFSIKFLQRISNKYVLHFTMSILFIKIISSALQKFCCKKSHWNLQNIQIRFSQSSSREFRSLKSLSLSVIVNL